MKMSSNIFETRHINIINPPKKRITLFFSEEEFADVERICLYLNLSARPWLKQIVITELERLNEQREAHSKVH
jgi:hypothetical protein